MLLFAQIVAVIISTVITIISYFTLDDIMEWVKNKTVKSALKFTLSSPLIYGCIVSFLISSAIRIFVIEPILTYRVISVLGAVTSAAL